VAFIDNVADCLMDVASVYGPYWEPYFKKLLPSLLDYLVRSKPKPLPRLIQFTGSHHTTSHHCAHAGEKPGLYGHHRGSLGRDIQGSQAGRHSLPQGICTLAASAT
jgi:hypothetical protein